MFRRLVQVENRCITDVCPLHDGRPLVPGAGLENLGHTHFESRPLLTIHLRRQLFTLEPELLKKERVELGLDGADGDVLGVPRLVDIVEMGAGIEHVGTPLIPPDTH